MCGRESLCLPQTPGFVIVICSYVIKHEERVRPEREGHIVFKIEEKELKKLLRVRGREIAG